jgi:hypothetical protein
VGGVPSPRVSTFSLLGLGGHSGPPSSQNRSPLEGAALSAPIFADVEKPSFFLPS